MPCPGITFPEPPAVGSGPRCEVWWFYSGGQPSSTTTALSLPLSSKRKGRKYSTENAMFETRKVYLKGKGKGRKNQRQKKQSVCAEAQRVEKVD